MQAFEYPGVQLAGRPQDRKPLRSRLQDRLVDARACGREFFTPPFQCVVLFDVSIDLRPEVLGRYAQRLAPALADSHRALQFSSLGRCGLDRVGPTCHAHALCRRRDGCSLLLPLRYQPGYLPGHLVEAFETIERSDRLGRTVLPDRPDFFCQFAVENE